MEGLKIDIATGRTSINAALSAVTQAEASITQSQSQIDNANSSLKTASKQLQQKKAGVRGTDLAVYNAQLNQAIASKQKIETQRSDLVITAPFAGVVTDVQTKKGEVVGPTKDVVALLSHDKLQIKVNIVENNIIKIAVGQNARITFDAIPNKEYSGKIVSIDPAEKEINGTTYYQTTVEVTDTVDFLRSGMTANVWVFTKEIPDALYVPSSSLFKVGNGWNVKVTNGSISSNVSIVPGAKDKNGMIQIISGLKEGDTVILDDTNSYDTQ
jgi:HlyD family secretion protein